MRIVKDSFKQMEYPSSQSTPSSSSASSLAPATDTSSVCSGSGESFSEPSSLLSHLRASDLARKRAVHRNPPPAGKRRSRGRGANEPKSVTPRQRVSEHPGEWLTVSNKRLFCKACREELSLVSSVINNHLKSTKHQAGKERLAKKEKAESDIAEALVSSDKELHPVGETLPQDQRVYRIKVVMAFLRAGVPLSKLTSFRELLEENGFRLSDRRHMSDVIPFIASQEQAKIKGELCGKDISVIFDGTTRMGEAMGIVVRYVSSEWKIEQQLVRLQLLAQSMSGEEVARELISTLSVRYSINSTSLLATMRDRAAVNNVALRTLKVVYPALMDVGCFSHTLDLVGTKFSTPNLVEFTMAWVSLFSHSPKARLMWREQTGRSVTSYSQTRWWSRWEIMKELLELYGDVEVFLNQYDQAPATRQKLLQFFQDQQKKAFLEIELAVVIDAGMPFVTSTYKLEGDGSLAFECYEVISSLTATVNMPPCYPNLQAVVRRLSGGNMQVEQQLNSYALSCVQPGLQYYRECLTGCMKVPLAAFKVARLFCPSKVNEMKPDFSAVDSLSVFPFLDSTALGNLKLELPQYIAASEDTDPNYSPAEFWRAHELYLPSWATTAKKVILVQPSSAACERVFSLLNNSFNAQQDSSLQDYIETSVMMQYNYR